MTEDQKEKTVRRHPSALISIVGKVALGLTMILVVLPPTPSIAESSSLKQRSTNLKSRSADLNQRLSALTKDISRQRYGELEDTRTEIRKKLDAWMSGDTKMDGQAVQRTLAEAYRIAEEYGTDVALMKRIHGVARAAILRANFFSAGDTGIGTMREFTDKVKDTPIVGNVVHFYGLVDKEEERIARSMEKRVVQYRNLLQVYIKALTIRDPIEALAHMKNYANLARSYVTGQESQAIDADTKMMLAFQNGVVEYVGAFPLVGPAMDTVMLYLEEDLAGNKVDRAEWATTQIAFRAAFGSLIKLGGLILKAGVLVTGAVAKRMPDAFAHLGAMGTKLAQLSGPARAALNKRLAGPLGDQAPGGDVVGTMVKRITGSMPPNVAAKAKILAANVDSARKALKELGDIGKRTDLFNIGRKQGKALVDDFERILKEGSPKQVRDAMLAIQANKHGMQVLKDASPATINAFNKGIGNLYKEADAITTNNLVGKYFDGFAKSLGKDPANLSPAERKAIADKLKGKIKIELITNPSSGKVKPSFDRDITAKIEVSPGVWKDVPGKVLDESYAPAFYKVAKGVDPPSTKASKDLMAKMDQVGTDALHTESYGAGAHDLGVALEKNKRGIFKDPEQIGQVYAYKGNHMFDKADKAIAGAKKAGNPAKAQGMRIDAESHVEEGMRNLHKQFDKQIEQRVAGFNKRLAKQGRPAIKIPDHLRRANAIMGAVGKTESPASASKKLAAMGMTPRGAAKQMGDFVTKIHKTMGKGKQIVEKGKGSSGSLLHYPRDWAASGPKGLGK
ncbi:MAG: hypothetical protein HN731_12980 [Rhodospirillaceae bacterium]|nr:hypothetical protein [Rhodospirillaceae bacterium]